VFVPFSQVSPHRNEGNWDGISGIGGFRKKRQLFGPDSEQATFLRIREKVASF
jgi:hypothetical protein